MIFVFDTNVWVTVLRGRIDWEVLASRLGTHELAVPAMVKAELLYGARASAKPDENTASVLAVLSAFAILPFDDAATAIYADIRARLRSQGTPIGPEDLVIAATTLAAGATLVTGNVGEFSRVPGLNVVDWS
jgi:tRNA(fMet)-specific endonuclease VapC